MLVRPGTAVIFDSAGCVVPVAPGPGGAVEVARVGDAKAYAVFRAPATLGGETSVTIQTGPRPDSAVATACQSPEPRQYTFAVDRTPELSEQTLGKAFRVLMLAFVLAVLLESAFTLLFNWRLFQELLVGKAWRTPIMFVGALVVVRTFGLDLMAALFDAYNPAARAAAQGGWLTSILTAMILAGGSVGVNRILVALGFRSQLRPDVLAPPLHEGEAWVSVRLSKRPTGSTSYQVSIEELTQIPTGTPAPPATVGFIRGPQSTLRRLRDVLFPVRHRIPPSGGRTVRTDRLYEIVVTARAKDSKGNPTRKRIDALGHEITTADPATIFKFAPRAIVDFEVPIA